jgi:hypothetical protein
MVMMMMMIQKTEHKKFNILIQAQFVLLKVGTQSMDAIFILDAETRVIVQYRRL